MNNDADKGNRLHVHGPALEFMTVTFLAALNFYRPTPAILNDLLFLYGFKLMPTFD